MYIDEAIVSSNTRATKCWSNYRSHLQFNSLHFEAPPVYLIAAISKENGLEALEIHSQSFNTATYLRILPTLDIYGRNYIRGQMTP